jgi:DNA polymerase-3 subunit alpha
MMASFTLEDLTGTIEVLVFPRIFAQSHGIRDDQILVIEGRYNVRDDERKLFVERITELDQASEYKKNFGSGSPKEFPTNKHPLVRNQVIERRNTSETVSNSEGSRKLYLRFSHEGTDQLGEIIPVLRRYSGANPVYFYFVEDKKLVQGKREFWVQDMEDLVQDLSKILGKDNVAWKIS